MKISIQIRLIESIDHPLWDPMLRDSFFKMEEKAGGSKALYSI